ncbi:rfrA pentapeptide repeat-containing protein [Calothrix sp. NIES-4101]|nr:rfrA pentapeptide repeat-containing protein [Calothrix sp. NIES-4101]
MFTHDYQTHEPTDLNFSHQKLRGRSFRGKNLAGANFSHADIKGADFREANLVNTNFSYAQAGVQTHWAIFSVVCSLLLAIVSVFSAWIAAVIFTETIFQSSEPLYDGVPNVENGIPGFIVAIVLGVFCLSSIRQGLVMALLAMAGVGGAIVVILGAVLGLNLGASGLKMVGAGAWRAAAAGIWAIIATVSGAIAVFAATFEARPKLMSVLKIACGVVAISLAITVFKIANSHPTALIMPALPTSVGVAIALLSMGIYIGWRCLLEDKKFTIIQEITRILFTLGGTNFGDANLESADFSQANLKSADLRYANITGTNFHLAKNLDLTRVDGTILSNSPVRDLVVSHRGVGKSYRGCNLEGANLAYADLSDADLTQANISKAILIGTILERANLTQIQALATNFQQAYLTAACLENWHIDAKTQLENITCEYIYLRNQQQEKHPPSGIFREGEFSKLFQVVVDTIDLIFRNGVDWEALVIAMKEVAAKNYTEKLTINSIDNKGDGLIVVKVNVSENADKGKIHQDLQQKYQQQLKILETRYQAELEGKQAQIEIYRQHSAEMAEINKLLAQQGLNYHHLPSRINKLIILTMGEGNFDDGFPVTALVCSDEHPLPMTFIAKLPPAPNILQLYQQWRQIYRSQNWFGRITFDTEDTITNFSHQELNYYGNQLEINLDNWLNSIQFQPIVKELHSHLTPREQVPVIIQTKDIHLQRLPWHLWDFFRHYRQAEIALSAIGERAGKSQFTRHQTRILTILGNSTGIDVEADRQVLEKLPECETVFLVEPTIQELHQQLWDEQGWDIFCFSGHSSSQIDGSAGKMLINQTKLLGIKELKHALTKAIERGLQLAIFNSCDGLGLAKELADLHIPQMIIMREPVPDKVAQEFLKNFLTTFSRGESLYTAVRQARERLEAWEDEFPYATWLPVLFQNSAEVGMSWGK